MYCKKLLCKNAMKFNKYIIVIKLIVVVIIIVFPDVFERANCKKKCFLHSLLHNRFFYKIHKNILQLNDGLYSVKMHVKYIISYEFIGKYLKVLTIYSKNQIFGYN